MASMNDILSIDKLPALPAALAQAIPLLLDPDSNWASIEAVIRRDEALTLAVLRLANSAMYGGSARQYDLRQALARLGRVAVRRCLLEQQVSRIVGDEVAAFDLQRGALWRSALAGAIAAEQLAQEHKFPEPALAFVCALLRDIGKLAINVKYGADYLKLISAHATEGRSFTEAEDAALGFNHAQVGAELARRWHLPERVAQAIECHHQPPPEGPGHDVLFDIVHAADLVCRWAGCGVGIDGMNYPLAEHVRLSLSLDRPTAEREIAFVWEQVQLAEDAMNQSGKQGVAA
jgi:putative nucleotidyltransferase with HDIG domain